MLRKLIATALLPAAAAGAIALATAGTASAAPWICTSGKASATQLASPMCTGASGNTGGGTSPGTSSLREHGPAQLYIYNPSHPNADARGGVWVPNPRY